MLEHFSGVNSKGLYLSSEWEKENCRLVYTSSIKRETRWFHVVVVQQRQRNVQKSVMHVQSCCFVLLCRSPCPPRRRCISSLKDERAAPLLFSRRIALGTRMDLLYGLRSTRVVMRLLLLDMQRALYLWSNSSYTQDMEKGSVLEPGFRLGLCRWEIHTLKLQERTWNRTTTFGF